MIRCAERNCFKTTFSSRSLLLPGGGNKYLQDVLHRDVHLQVLLAVSLQPVVGKPVVIWCSKQIAVYHRLRKNTMFICVLHLSETVSDFNFAQNLHLN